MTIFHILLILSTLFLNHILFGLLKIHIDSIRIYTGVRQLSILALIVTILLSFKS